MKKEIIKLAVGDIQRWQGVRNSDTGEIDGGWLHLITEVRENGYTTRGIRINNVKNRYEAIKKYKANPENPNLVKN